MEAVEPWEQEKQAHAAQLYAALAALVGDVPMLHHTSASLSWRTGAGIQGHWRMIQDQCWLGRIVPSPTEGIVSVQLALTLEHVQQDEARLGLALPVMYHARSGDGLVTSHDPETPAIYAAALALVTQLGVELSAMLAHLLAGPEERRAAP